jgi:hypothetical protein
MLAYEDGGISILGMMFDDVDEYIEYFDSINSDDTSYCIKKGGVQYKEDKYILPKELVIKWFNDNVKE